MFDNPIILIVAVAVGILQWLWRRSQEEKQNSERPPPTDQPLPRATETQSEEERIRRFLEALGQPRTAAPPPKVAPKREIQPRTPATEPRLPPLTTVPPPLPPVPTFTIPPRPPPPPPVERPIFKPAMVQEVGFEVQDLSAPAFTDLTPEHRRTAAAQKGPWLELSSTQNLRNAIVLREIFGPPRSLQPLENRW